MSTFNSNISTTQTIFYNDNSTSSLSISSSGSGNTIIKSEISADKAINKQLDLLLDKKNIVRICSSYYKESNLNTILPPISCATITGTIQSGFKYLTNFTVSLYKSHINYAELIEKVDTDVLGNFNIFNNIHKDNFYYLIATNNNINLLFIIGNFIPNKQIIINEITTISGIYTFSKFYNMNISIYGNKKALHTAKAMYDNLVNNNGTFSNIIQTNPNGNETNTLQLINNLCNLMALVIDDYNSFLELVLLTTIIPTNTLNCFYYITQNSTNNIQQIINLSNSSTIYYTNTLINIPDALTICIKFNKTGNNNYLFGGTGNIIIDNYGKIWILNNVVQGTLYSSNFNVVLNPNGSPSNVSPLFGGGILKSNKNTILMGNYGWGGENPESGSISIFEVNGNPLTPNSTDASFNNGGFTNNTYRVQGLTVDKNNNIWMASFGNDRVVVYINGDPSNNKFIQFPINSGPFGVKCDNIGFIYVSFKGDFNITPPVLSSIYKFYLNSNNNIVEQLIYIDPYVDSSTHLQFMGISVDSYNNIFVNSLTTNNIYKFDSSGILLTIISGGGLSSPWGSHIDGNNNLVVANFSSLNIDNPVYGISYFKNDGTPISPSTGFTLLTGGDQVLLATGEPLYGAKSPLTPNYNPIMRQTGINVDCAGNIWTCNNWKPCFFSDNFINPGGDGMVVFIGLASPLT